MTKRRERDPTRIAQLLASEVTGRSAGPLGRLAVVDAEPEATPSAAGSLAYRLALAEAEDDGRRSPRERAGEGTVTDEESVAGEESVASEQPVPGEGTDRGEDGASGGGGACRLIGAVHLHQEAAVVSLPAAGRDSRAIGLPDGVLSAGDRTTPADRTDVTVARDGGRLTVEIRTGAAVKPAVDILTTVVDSLGSDPEREDAPSGRE